MVSGVGPYLVSSAIVVTRDGVIEATALASMILEATARVPSP